jgi:hypothetical protein
MSHDFLSFFLAWMAGILWTREDAVICLSRRVESETAFSLQTSHE